MPATQKPEIGRLLPPLPSVPFVEEPPATDRFEVRILPDGQLFFRGPQERVEEFLQACAEQGIVIEIDHMALCG